MKNLGWGLVLAAGVAWGQAPVERAGGVIDLPTSKQIVGVVPGGPQRLSSLPVTMAVSPDGRYVVTVNDGYGSAEGGYNQGLAVMDTRTGKLVDYPDARTPVHGKQVLFSGLAFSGDGKRLYGSIVSLTDPKGSAAGDTGTGIAVYSFVNGVVKAETVWKLPAQKLAAGRKTLLGKDPGMGVSYPAAIAAITRPAGQPLFGAHSGPLGLNEVVVADNLSDDVLLMDAATGSVEKRFDLSENDVVPSAYPIDLKVSRDGTRAYVALWNSSEVVELDLVKGVVGRKLTLLKGTSATSPGSHPVALEMAPDGKTLYVALSNRDAVAAVDLNGGAFALKGYFDTRLPGQSFYGAEPVALAAAPDGMLYVANMASDAVAVIDPRKLTKRAVKKGMVEPDGFIPTEWLPTAVAVTGGKLYVATGKGTGTGPNNRPQPLGVGGQKVYQSGGPKWVSSQLPFSYIATLLHGSLAAVDLAAAKLDLKASTANVLESNRMKAGEERIAWAVGVAGMSGRTAPTQVLDARPRAPSAAADRGPIKHVIYIIRENRTYDQILGDLEVNAKPVGNGDKSLAMYGAKTTPNFHKLVAQFGVLDNFYDSAEVSGDGHVWSNTAIGTDYLERTWQLNYRGDERQYDYEGVVSEGIPLEQGIPDVNEPQTGYIWGNVVKHGETVYHFGEYIETKFCTDKKAARAVAGSQDGPMHEGAPCARVSVKPGETLPEAWGGGVNRWPWAIPLMATNKGTKPELVGHFAEEYPDFELTVPDQIREGIFERHLARWVADRKAGKDTMPNFIQLRMGNDHTSATTAGKPRPFASVADNDLAVGRVVEAISHSAYWDDTVICVLEDDAQNGADHVDAHRSVALLASKYAPHGKDGMPFVDSRFYSTASMVRTMETLLGLPPMNNNDALSSMMGSLFTGPGDQAPFVADRSNDENGLIYQMNAPTTPGAKESAKMDFSHADRADAQKVNVILWEDAMGDRPIPAMLLEKRKKTKDADDR
jgi:DNA-binding beta-propeller fold protein YncE